MKIKSTFIAAMILLFVSANCHASKKVVERHSFSFSENDDEVVLEIEVSEGQPQTNSNLGTKIIEVKKDSVLIAKMETIRLEDYDVGEGLQFIKQENNLLFIQQSFGDSRYIVVSVLRFEYSAGKMVLNNYEERRFNRFADEQDDETKMIQMNDLIDMNEIDDEVIYSLHAALFSHEEH